jgi:hypothetical protein
VFDNSADPGLAHLQTISTGGALGLNGSAAITTALQTVSGTLRLDGTSSLSNANAPASGTTTIASGGVFQGNGGTLTGNLINDGTVHPGDSPGSLTVTGNYHQDASGALNVEINGTGAGQFGQLTVNGTGGSAAVLGGTVNLLPSTAYAASAATNDTIPFLHLVFGTVSGTFATVNTNPALNNGHKFTVDYSQGGNVRAIVGPGTVIVTPPKVSGASLSSTSFKAKNGTSLTVTLSAAAKITVTINGHGRKHKGKCSLKAKHGKKCTINAIKTLTFQGLAGANTVDLNLAGLKKGKYTAVITATNSGGTSGKTKLTFKIT